MFNISCILYMGLFMADFFVNEQTCPIGQRMTNMGSHFFYLTFNAFLLFKTYAVSEYNDWVARLALLLWTHRFAWSLVDVFASNATWDREFQYCNFVQYPPSGIGYNAADIFCDWFATVVSITFTWKYMNSNVTRIGEIVLQDNVFRSIVILIVNSYAIYLSSVSTGPFAPMVYLGQGYVYTRSVNLELLWIYLRKRSMNLSANSHESIKNTIQASSQRLAESRRQSAPVLSAVEERDSDIRESDNLRISRSKSHAMFASLGRTADSLQSPMLKARSISSSTVSKSP
ncbi:hypothetical protein HDU79_009050, partial [Rhizoclosmatium sp. JEL0117]